MVAGKRKELTRRQITDELGSIEFKHRILEMWKRGKSREYTAEVLGVSLTKLEKWRALIREEIGFPVKFDYAVYGRNTVANTKINYKDYIIEQIKNIP